MISHVESDLISNRLQIKCTRKIKDSQGSQIPTTRSNEQVVEFVSGQNGRQLPPLLQLGRRPVTERLCSRKRVEPFVVKETMDVILYFGISGLHYSLIQAGWHTPTQASQDYYHLEKAMSLSKFISIFIVFRNPRIKSFFSFYHLQ